MLQTQLLGIPEFIGLMLLGIYPLVVSYVRNVIKVIIKNFSLSLLSWSCCWHWYTSLIGIFCFYRILETLVFPFGLTLLSATKNEFYGEISPHFAISNLLKVWQYN